MEGFASTAAEGGALAALGKGALPTAGSAGVVVGGLGAEAAFT